MEKKEVNIEVKLSNGAQKTLNTKNEICQIIKN